MKCQTKSKVNLVLAIMWSICLLANIISAAIGETPGWVLVFCPLTILVFDRWEHYIEECYKEKLFDE